MDNFFRFPHTPHIVWLGQGTPRDDKILLPREIDNLLHDEVIIEEKIDGANIGFSLDNNGDIRVQNRGSYLDTPYYGQFSRLKGWLGQHGYHIQKYLTGDLIIFGEWCAAQHSLYYHNLPDYFLLFDIYDKIQKRFWSVQKRNQWAEKMGIKTVPCVGEGSYSTDSLVSLLYQLKSYYRKGRPEGIVIRKDLEDWNISRGKIVQPEFVQNIEDHWSSKNIKWNSVSYDWEGNSHV